MPRLALVLVLLFASVGSAAAQDRLFTGAREVGAFGHFGEDLGAAPPWLGPDPVVSFADVPSIA